MNRLKRFQEYAAAALAIAQQLMENRANNTRNPYPLFRQGDKVWLNLKTIKTPQPKKLAWLNVKYTITKVISPHKVELDVPSKIWLRFHVQFLRKAGDNQLQFQNKDDEQPPPIVPKNFNYETDNIAPEQYVDRILRPERMRRGKKWIRKVSVKWKGFAELK